MTVALSGSRVIVDLQPSFAEAADLCALPNHHSDDGPNEEPPLVQPFGLADYKKDNRKTDYLDKVSGHEEAHGAGRIGPPNEMADQEADSKKEHHQGAAETAGEQTVGAIEGEGNQTCGNHSDTGSGRTLR
jgi:hypothetical protein